MQGSQFCTCDAGYYYNHGTCTDVDECADGTSNCGENTECINTDQGVMGDPQKVTKF